MITILFPNEWTQKWKEEYLNKPDFARHREWKTVSPCGLLCKARTRGHFWRPKWKKEKSLNPVRLCNPTDCSPLSSSVHGISSQEYWSGCHFLLLGIFLTQGSNPGLPHCRQILYRLSHERSPVLAQHNPQHPLLRLILFWLQENAFQISCCVILKQKATASKW